MYASLPGNTLSASYIDKPYSEILISLKKAEKCNLLKIDFSPDLRETPSELQNHKIPDNSILMPEDCTCRSCKFF